MQMRTLLISLLLDVIATVNGTTPITRAEIDAAIAPRLKKIAVDEEEVRRAVLQQLIDEKLLAAEASRRNVSLEALLAAEAPTREARAAFLAALAEKAGVRIHLKSVRTAIVTAGRPTAGPPSAPVTIVVFSDFQCPFCRGTAEVLREVQRLESARARLVFRHFPLPMHDRAERAAEASECAAREGKFWPVHDALFANPEKLSDADLTATALAAGVDAQTFAQCLGSGIARAAVDADKKAGIEAGVEGTPAIFINGRRVNGPRTVDALRRLIAEEVKGEMK